MAVDQKTLDLGRNALFGADITDDADKVEPNGPALGKLDEGGEGTDHQNHGQKNSA